MSGQLDEWAGRLDTETMIDFARLPGLAEGLRDAYAVASPFPHIFIEDLVSAEWVAALNTVFPRPGEDKNWRQINDRYTDGDPSQSGKMGLQNPAQLSPLIRELLLEMNSAAFLRFLETLTGIRGLLPDPKLQGGGAHQTLPGGYLGVHADFTEHRYYKLSRRLNVLVYLNEDWDEAYGGHLELWSRDLSRCERRIAPLAGRCVVFSTDDSSFHGHPEPLTCPSDRTRRSVALYYYSYGRDDATAPVTTTDWHKTARDGLPGLE